MHSLNLDFIDLFSAKTAQRGLDYFRRNKVISLELDDEAGVLSGQVKGSGGKVYLVDIELNPYPGDPDEDPISGTCTCPMQFNCKHVCALLLKAEKYFGADRMNALLGEENWDNTESELDEMITDLAQTLVFKGDALVLEELKTHIKQSLPSILSEGSGSLSAEESRLENSRNRWLTQLKAVSKPKSESPHTDRLSANRSTTNCLVYFLEPDRYGLNRSFSVRLYLSRYLKKGGFGKPNIYNGAHHCIQNNNWPVSINPEDIKILKTAWVDGSLNYYGSELSLKGEEGFELLTRIINTGRCLVDLQERIVVEPAEPLRGEVQWQADEKGLQQPALVDQQGHHLNLLATTPPSYLKVFEQKAECGELTQLPNGALLQTLLDAPPLDNKGVEEASKVLSNLIHDPDNQGIALPKKISARIIKPKPVLRLDGVPWTGEPATLRKNHSPTEETLARAQLSFSYDGNRVSHASVLDTLPSKHDEQTVIPRQRQTEETLAKQLPFELQPSYRKKIVTKQLMDHDLIMGPPGLHSQKLWLAFMNQTLPELEDNGWLIEIDESFPFQFETLSEDDWYAGLEESENDWFNLQLGFNIDGKSIDLLPLLARQLDALPDQTQLKSMEKDAPVPIQIPGGQFINMPAERLSLILGTLLELFGDRPLSDYRLQTHHAEIWEELHNGLDLPWSGGEKLLELGKKLKKFKRLKKVKPAKHLNAELRPYQQQGLSWLQFLREYGLNGILADDMGLGKTLQTLAHLQLEKQRLTRSKSRKPSLVVCPTSLLHNWAREAQRFTPNLNVHIHHGTRRESEAIQHADLVLTSYGVVQRDYKELSETTFHLLILDEAQAVKNPNAKSAKAVRCLQASHKVCLTGTPMENHLGELWSLFDFLMPGFLGARDQFTRFYRTPIEKHNQREPSKRLQKRIAPFMMRRKKELVAKELPPKTEILRTTELSGPQRDLYETIRASMEARVQAEIEKKGLARSQIVILDALLKMRQACCDPSLVKLEQAEAIKDSAKLDLLMTLVKPIVEEGRKILIFSQFTSMLTLIETRLKAAGIPWVKLTGQTRNRKQPIQDFQEGRVPVFLISLKAGGTGLNLTAADTVIHYDPWWNPAVEEQASDRAHRIGQDKPVFVYKLVTEGTVEEKIQALKEKKQAIADSLYGDTGRKKKQTLTAEDLQVLFEPIKSA
ncbi:DEAD/DEAH box helicase [Endozoicomonas numazuensis]|uniref:DEAD/DEAH box helicase n=1 Tax=Endozoicomonas numazuensis TaxID=1137799 RepID=UPI00068A59EB|nr:SNF2-related protein [Endozoicomonas numazuensis]